MKAPERAELEALEQTLSERVWRHLERQGQLVRDADHGYIELEPEGEEGRVRVLGSDAGRPLSKRCDVWIWPRVIMALRPGQGSFLNLEETSSPSRPARPKRPARGCPSPGAIRAPTACTSQHMSSTLSR